MKFKIFLQATCAFLGTVAISGALLFSTAAIPNEKIEKNMQSSVEYFKTAEAFADTNGRLGGVVDNYADAILLGIAWNMGRSDLPASVIDTKYNDGGELGENYGLYLTVCENAGPNADYTRYVHGTAAFVRLFHLFCDVKAMKTAALTVLIFLIALNAFILIRKKHTAVAAALVLSFVLIGFWNIALSLEYMPTFIIALLLTPLYIFFEKKGDGALVVLSVVGGAAVGFFDFLTTETVVLLLPLMTVTAIRSLEGRLGKFAENFFRFLKNGAVFLGSYAAVFLFKWSLASLVTGENKFVAALSSAGERIGGDADGIAGFLRIPAALGANLTAAFGGAASARLNIPLVLLGSFVFIGVAASLGFLFRKGETDKTAIYLLLSSTAAVLLRFVVLGNHSYIHCFFTYRALVSVIYAVLLCIIISSVGKPQERSVKRRAKG